MIYTFLYVLIILMYTQMAYMKLKKRYFSNPSRNKHLFKLLVVKCSTISQAWLFDRLKTEVFEITKYNKITWRKSRFVFMAHDSGANNSTDCNCEFKKRKWNFLNIKW